MNAMASEKNFNHRIAPYRRRSSQQQNVYWMRTGEKNSHGCGREVIQIKPGIHPDTEAAGVLVRISYPVRFDLSNQISWLWAQTFVGRESAQDVVRHLVEWSDESVVIQTGCQAEESVSFMKCQFDSDGEEALKMRVWTSADEMRPKRRAITKITSQQALLIAEHLKKQCALENWIEERYPTLPEMHPSSHGSRCDFQELQSCI